MASENLYGQYTPPTSGGGKYLKIEDGQTVKLRIMGYPVVFNKQFPGSDNVSTRYAWVVFNHGTQEAQSFEQGITFFKKIQALSLDPDWGNTSDYDVKVTRMGTGTETEYTINPSPKSDPLTKEQLEKISTINLTALHEGSVPLEDAVKGNPVLLSGKLQSRSWEQDGQKRSKLEVVANDVVFIKSQNLDQQTASRDTVVSDISDEPIDLSQIPF